MSRPGPRSAAWSRRARAIVAGGSSSPARDVCAVGLPAPLTGHAGAGPYLFDADGNRYVDYLQAFGVGVLGHGHPAVTAAAVGALRDGAVWGVAARAEARLGEAIAAAIPGMERVRFTASGTEAVMAAVRLARAATGRSVLVKFDAGYHGHFDAVLGHTGSAAAHAGGSDDAPAGVPAGALADTVTLPWNDADAVDAYMAAHGPDVGAILVEPIAGNIGIVAPRAAFIAAVGRARDRGALVIADEVVSAFRFAYGGAQARVGLAADLTCVGKIVGGGLPIGAYGGAAALMDRMSPDGPVFQAGTFSGHPVACAAGVAALAALARPGVYERLDALGARLETGLRAAAAAAGLPATLSRVAGGLTLWPGRDPGTGPVATAADVEATDPAAFGAMYRALLDEGVLIAPSRHEAWFVTLAHDEAVIDASLAAAARALARVASLASAR